MTATVVVTRIEHGPLDCAALLDGLVPPGCGGVVVFEGRVRPVTGGRAVLRLEYEAYEAVASEQLSRIARETAAAHGLGAVLAAHRVGCVQVGETALLVAAAAAHRGEAFAAAGELVSRVKAEVAIWKREVFAGEAVWAGMDAPSPATT